MGVVVGSVVTGILPDFATGEMAPENEDEILDDYCLAFSFINVKLAME